MNGRGGDYEATTTTSYTFCTRSTVSGRSGDRDRSKEEHARFGIYVLS